MNSVKERRFVELEERRLTDVAVSRSAFVNAVGSSVFGVGGGREE